MNEVGKEYLVTVVTRVRYYKSLAEGTFDQLGEQDFSFQPGEESNSIAVIIQHMAGNMLSRWTNFLTEDGEKAWRERDTEFEEHELSKKELIRTWENGWSCFFEALESLKKDDLLKSITIRGESLSVMDAINRQLAHYSYHVGQIVFIGKILRGKDWKSLSIPKKRAG